jgi:glycosyltransferase involved in cell wall biosynthesis
MMGKPLLHLVESSARHPWLEKLILELNVNNFQQELFSLNKPGEINIYLDGKCPSFSSKSRFKIIRLTKVFVKILEFIRKNPDGVLLVQGHLPAIVGSVACRITKYPYCYIHHNQPLYFELLKKEKPIRGSIHNIFYLFYVRNARIIQSLSSDVTNFLHERNVKPDRIIELGHGIDFDEFERKLLNSQESLPPNSEPIILMVGRLAWEKNYTTAIEAMKSVCEKIPNVTLLIAGEGPQKEALSKLVVKLGLNSNVAFLGMVENIPALMKRADVLLHTSFTESYGQIYVEAALVDLSIISFPVGVASDTKFSELARLTLLSDNEPSSIAKSIVQTLGESKIERRSFPENRDRFFMHNQKFIFSTISQYLRSSNRISVIE